MCTHPLDLAKVRMQTAEERGKTMMQTILHVFRNEGVFALYKGLSASILRQATYSTTRFGAYEKLKDWASGGSEVTPPFHVILPMAMAAGWLGGVVGNPADIINIRMQNDMALDPAHRRNYRNALDGLFRMTREEGPKSLFRGLHPNTTRAVLMTASQMVSYDEFKKALVNHVGMDSKSIYTHFAASMLAGLVATTVCSPVDVVKTRIMNAKEKHQPALAILKEAVRSEGILFAFRGWLPSFIRLGPHTIVTFIVLEKLKSLGIGMHS
ncbi:mitochondrial carrier domain-containing protein [Lipomyces tetrasporus]|uniref:Mitochondrial carrier domain-containing protein n=1 Tax=Lipomyces tetrasporus TaxID=54092 RepID=A0AAD7VPY9_9ASCO|nr:mitochondrial carrier domain-containing protein [Lipomyces tetrasporus]KAJ8097331.1 mitochondrial carrier domain-containing protein [Lipomyces tetrasporus]